MLHPHLREIVRRVEREVSVEATACGNGSPSRAVDLDPVSVEPGELHGWVMGVAAGLGTTIQHGVSERMFTVREPCTHPGHYELE